MGKIRTISIDARDRDGTYSDVVEFLESIRGEFGSAVNAAVQVIRGSGPYKQWAEKRGDVGESQAA